MAECVFCEIVAGKSPSSIIFEDDVVLVLVTIGPVNPGHAMVIPKKHFAYMAEMDEETGAHLFKITMRTAQAIRESGVKCEGVNLFLADGEAAFQAVLHLHMHVFPRFVGDPFKSWQIGMKNHPVTSWIRWQGKSGRLMKRYGVGKKQDERRSRCCFGTL